MDTSTSLGKVGGIVSDCLLFHTQVTYEEGKEIADSNNALFFEASAKTGENVTKVFTAIANHLPDDDLFDERDQQFEDSFRLTPPPPANPSKPNKCPC